MPSINEQERKSLLFSHYPYHRHGSSSIDKNIDYSDNRHLIKNQQHGDPYSIKWVTEGPQKVKDSGMYFSSYIIFTLIFFFSIYC